MTAVNPEASRQAAVEAALVRFSCPREDLNTETGEISVSCSPGWLWMTSQVLAGTRSGPQR